MALLFLVGIWFVPYLQPTLQWCDKQIFLILNNTLHWHKGWLRFWGYLNHPAETWLNLVIMISINIFICITLKGKQKKLAFLNLFYYWFMFQLILPMNHVLFSDLLNIHRISPSLTLTPPIWLSEAMGIPGIKDASESTFPAGHTLVATYWLLFSLKTAPRAVYPILGITALLLCFNRLFSGAHWASDIIFTCVLALVWYYWVSLIPLYTYLQQRFTK